MLEQKNLICINKNIDRLFFFKKDTFLRFIGPGTSESNNDNFWLKISIIVIGFSDLLMVP